MKNQSSMTAKNLYSEQEPKKNLKRKFLLIIPKVSKLSQVCRSLMLWMNGKLTHLKLLPKVLFKAYKPRAARAVDYFGNELITNIPVFVKSTAI